MANLDFIDTNTMYSNDIHQIWHNYGVSIRNPYLMFAIYRLFKKMREQHSHTLASVQYLFYKVIRKDFVVVA